MTPAPFAAALKPSLPRPRTAPDPARLLRPLDVAPRLRAPLAKLGLETVGDLLESLPFRHEDLSNVRGLAEVEEGELATVLGRILRVRERGARRRNLRIVVADIEDRHAAGGPRLVTRPSWCAPSSPGRSCWPAGTRAAAPPASS